MFSNDIQKGSRPRLMPEIKKKQPQQIAQIDDDIDVVDEGMEDQIESQIDKIDSQIAFYDSMLKQRRLLVSQEAAALEEQQLAANNLDEEEAVLKDIDMLADQSYTFNYDDVVYVGRNGDDIGGDKEDFEQQLIDSIYAKVHFI